MKGMMLKYWLAGAIMLAAAAAAVVLKPTIRMAEQHPINLEQMIPQQFGDWKLDQTVAPVQVDPEVQAKLDKIYSQVLARTYVNAGGERVMLSIAYGSSQSDSLQAHWPEVCYGAQGFQILGMEKSKVRIPGGWLPVHNVTATLGQRKEWITYWLLVGDSVVRGPNEFKLAQITFGLKGVIPDGILFRVSAIGQDTDRLGLNQKFIFDLVKAKRQMQVLFEHASVEG